MIEELVETYSGFTGSELDDELARVELASRELEARRAALIAVGRNRRVHEADGHHSTRNYLRARCNSSKAVTTAQLRLARLVDALPAVGDALGAGHIGLAQANELARAYSNRRVGHLLPKVAELLLDHAEHLPFDDFCICVERWLMLADLDGSYREILDDVRSRTAHVVAVGTTVDVRATGGDALTAEKLIEIFRRFVEAEFAKDVEARRREFGDDADAHPLPRTAAQRRFDALATIFETAAAVGSVDAVQEPVVNIVGDVTTVAEAFTRAGFLLPNGSRLQLDDLDGDQIGRILAELTADPASLVDRRCETASGIPVHPMLVLQAALTGHVRRVVVDSAGCVVDLGHLRRLFTGSSRIAAAVLARHCSQLGCDVPAAGCDIDHMDEWVAHDGSTDQYNADVRCGRHDRFKHRERWRSRRSERGRVYNIRPDGTVVLPIGERPPDLTIDEQHRLVRQRLRRELPSPV